MAIDTKSPPLVIIGLDAGDPHFIKQWSEEGYMPTIASIMERGCWSQTAGPELISEHGVWVSLFSGMSRIQHGYYYFRQLKPGTYDLETFTGNDTLTPPFWFYLIGRGKKVAIIDVPDSNPIPNLPGIQLANWSVHDSWNPGHFPTMSEQSELINEVCQKFGPKLTPIENLDSSIDQDRELYHQLLGRVKKKGTLCINLIGRDRFDIIVVIFSESHAANHQFWKYYIKAQSGDTIKDVLTPAIRDVYQAIDREIGLILAQMPRKSNIFIVSSVGMEDDYPTTGLIEAFCRELGYQVPHESAGFSLKPLDLIRRFVPEPWRIAMSRHLSREKRESLLADQFRRGTNWRKTTAFAIPSAYTSFIRVNLQGREPEGIVKPGGEYMALLDQIEADLKQLVDPETNEPAVNSVGKIVELFDCPPHAALPDLFVEWKPSRFIQRVVHPKAELVQKKPDFFRRSDHSQNGFVAAMGPSIQGQGLLGDIEVLDLAPTFLYLMGEPIPETMTGRAINSILYG